MGKLVAGKLHCVQVTEANLNYHGSITFDPDHWEEPGILPMEFVEIWHKNLGAPISTYVILAESGSRDCILNGAAVRTCQPRDQIIICNSVYLDEASIDSTKPKILTFDESNNIRNRLSYSVDLAFDILEQRAFAYPFK
jgi:aspartate 1-decarboxylase